MKQIPIVRKAALKGLNDSECVAGYMAGFRHKTCPDSASYSFRHGWRNGASDAGYRPIDQYQRQLAASFVGSA